MRIRSYATWRTLVVPLLVLSLGLVACGGDGDVAGGDSTAGDGSGPPAGGGERPTVTVGSFNFPESTILAEIYAQALENAGIPVARELNIGARELIYPELESGAIDLLPEYVGSALAVEFGGQPTGDTAESLAMLQSELEEVGLTALEPAEAQDKNVFVVTSEFAESNGLTSVADLASLDQVVMAGPPECEARSTCYAGLVETYGLDNLSFQTIQETTVRVASLANGEIDLALLFSTNPAIAENDFVALEEPQGVVAAENVVPVLTQEVVDAYGEELTSVLNEVSAALTTEALIEMNGKANAGEDPAAIAKTWLEENGLL